MGAFVDWVPLTILVVMSGMALISAVTLAESIRDEDAVSAWIWAFVFASVSILAAWSIWEMLV